MSCPAATASRGRGKWPGSSTGRRPDEPRGTLGVCTYSYQLHWTAARQNQADLPFRDALGFLDHCHRLGAAGVQVGVGPWEVGYAGKVRAKADALGLYVEGQVGL